MSFQGIAAKVGKSWKDLDPKLKQGYDERAKQDKLRFKREKVRDSVDLLFYFHPLDVRGSSVASRSPAPAFFFLACMQTMHIKTWLVYSSPTSRRG